MLISLSYIFLVGMFLSWLCKKMGLPGLLGMIFTGILLGPYCLGLIDSSLLNISSELRKIALIIILMRAGLNLDLSDLKNNIRFVPLKKENNKFDFTHTLAKIKYDDNKYEIYIGNIKVSELHPQIFDISTTNNKVKIIVDNKEIETSFANQILSSYTEEIIQEFLQTYKLQVRFSLFPYTLFPHYEI